jgi:hypothetical protein
MNMKRNVFFLGLLVVLLAMGLVMASCGDDEEEDSSDSNYNGSTDNNGNTNTKGTVLVVNNSVYSGDVFKVWVYVGEKGSLLNYPTYVSKGSTGTFSNVPTGEELTVGGSGYLEKTYWSSTFTLTPGQTKTVTYDGTSIK